MICYAIGRLQRGNEATLDEEERRVHPSIADGHPHPFVNAAKLPDITARSESSLHVLRVQQHICHVGIAVETFQVLPRYKHAQSL